ncbi:hypothetical protein IFM89_005353, partial [Coptis chinensis]
NDTTNPGTPIRDDTDDDDGELITKAFEKVEGISWGATTDDRIQKAGIRLVSACRLCKSAEETLKHILWECRWSTQL